MDNREAIELLKIERDHMTPTIYTEPVEAMDMAIKALEENYPLKQRCFVLSKGLLCHFCKMECNHREDEANE